jgi:hypothetical protein
MCVHTGRKQYKELTPKGGFKSFKEMSTAVGTLLRGLKQEYTKQEVLCMFSILMLSSIAWF